MRLPHLAALVAVDLTITSKLAVNNESAVGARRLITSIPFLNSNQAHLLKRADIGCGYQEARSSRVYADRKKKKLRLGLGRVRTAAR